MSSRACNTYCYSGPVTVLLEKRHSEPNRKAQQKRVTRDTEALPSKHKIVNQHLGSLTTFRKRASNLQHSRHVCQYYPSLFITQWPEITLYGLLKVTRYRDFQSLVNYLHFIHHPSKTITSLTYLHRSHGVGH